MFDSCWVWRVALLVPFGLLTASQSLAGTFILERDRTEAFIRFDGPVDAGDFDKLTLIAEGVSDATVVLSSPGGMLGEGLRMGEFIRARGFSTLVIGGELCASACGFMWLAGTQKSVERDGLVGFHAVYLDKPGSPVSSEGNALAGAYMARLGYGDAAIVYATEVAPSDIRWLTPKDSTFLEMDVDWRTSIPLQEIPPSLSADQIDTILLSQPSFLLLKKRAPDAYKTLSGHLTLAMWAGQSWRVGFLGGLRAILEPEREMDKARLREAFIAAAIDLYPREIINLLVYRALLNAEVKSVERCADFGSPKDIKEYLDVSIYPIGDAKPEKLYPQLLAMSDKILARALSLPQPKIEPLTFAEFEEYLNSGSEIIGRWRSTLTPKENREYEKFIFTLDKRRQCEFSKALWRGVSLDAHLSKLWLREVLVPYK